MEVRPHVGTIRPHPEFKRTTDLAVIVLETPITPSLTGALLGQGELQAGEPITMAGYGYGEEVGQIFGFRYFRKNRITKVLPEGKVLYEQQGPSLYNGYHGGPCFREDESGQWLVGIASLGTADELALSSTHFHRKWILAEIELASGTVVPGLGSSEP
jgi:hypothetical protein